jgi:RES domain-containing protein
MEFFRIVLSKYASELFTSGVEGRWNREGEHVVYASTTRALALLENLVHRRHLGIEVSFTLLTLNLPDKSLIETISIGALKEDWQTSSNYSYCQSFTREWIKERKSLLIKVPSSIIPEEMNIMINANHPNFGKIKIIKRQLFSVDQRLIGINSQY